MCYFASIDLLANLQTKKHTRKLCCGNSGSPLSFSPTLLLILELLEAFALEHLINTHTQNKGHLLKTPINKT